jgi:hypothetical protein
MNNENADYANVSYLPEGPAVNQQQDKEQFTHASTADLTLTVGFSVWTRYFAFAVDTGINNFGLMMGFQHYVNESNNQGWAISKRSPGSGTANACFITLNNNGSAQYVLADPVNAPLKAGTVYDHLGVVTSAGNAIFYGQGVSVATSAYGTCAANTTTGLELGAPDNSFADDYRTMTACVWNRPLRADEALWLHQEPYAFLAPVGPRRKYSFIRGPVVVGGYSPAVCIIKG